MMEEVVDKQLLANLIRSHIELMMLEAGGVDNWINYDNSLTDSYFEGLNYYQVIRLSDTELIDLYVNGNKSRENN